MFSSSAEAPARAIAAAYSIHSSPAATQLMLAMNPRRTPRIGDQLQKSRFVILAQITLQIVARIAVGRIGILFERSGVVQDLLLEDRFQNHRARSGGVNASHSC